MGGLSQKIHKTEDGAVVYYIMQQIQLNEIRKSNPWLWLTLSLRKDRSMVVDASDDPHYQTLCKKMGFVKCPLLVVIPGMPDNRGVYNSLGNFICIGASSFERLMRGELKETSIAAHELGHAREARDSNGKLNRRQFLEIGGVVVSSMLAGSGARSLVSSLAEKYGVDEQDARLGWTREAVGLGALVVVSNKMVGFLNRQSEFRADANARDAVPVHDMIAAIGGEIEETLKKSGEAQVLQRYRASFERRLREHESRHGVLDDDQRILSWYIFASEKFARDIRFFEGPCHYPTPMARINRLSHLLPSDGIMR